MDIKESVLKKQIKDARDHLIKVGICAIDGSGVPVVEGAMNLLSLLAEGKLSISDEEKESMSKQVMRSGIGPTVDGKWNNPNHECSGCRKRLSLPLWADKWCPKCGTRQPGPASRAEAEEEKKAQKKTCPKCTHSNDRDADYCIMCGTKLPVQDSNVKDM